MCACDYHSLNDGSSTNSEDVVTSAGDTVPTAITLPMSLDLGGGTALLACKVLVHRTCTADTSALSP